MSPLSSVSRFFGQLAVRLALLLSFALLPLGILAVVTSLNSRAVDLRSTESALLSLTAEAAAGRRALIESAFTTARTLAQPVLERSMYPAACSALLMDTFRRAGVYSSIAYTEADGMARCTSDGEVFDDSDSPIYRQMMDMPVRMVHRREDGGTGGNPEMVVTHPVFEEGVLRGFLSISISLDSVAWLNRVDDDETYLRPVMFNQFADILAPGDTQAVQAYLPAEQRLITFAGYSGDTVFKGRTQSGEPAVFAVATLVPDLLYVIGVWDTENGPAAMLDVDRMPLLFPLAMWVASIAVVFFALYFLVIRHLRRLGRQMRRLALGDRTMPEPLSPRVSHELRDLHATFQKMALLIARDEAALSAALAKTEEMVQERTLLLKEVHHRVKNNLQLIASILNLQMRRLTDPRSRQVLQTVQDRVIGLATIHRSLYQTENLSDARADTLIEELLRHLFAVGEGPGNDISLKTDLEPIVLSPDQLVPLSLLLTEAVTNALKYAGRDAETGLCWMEVSLKDEDGLVTLVVVNSLAPPADRTGPDPSETGSGLGSELIDAFKMQLNAELEQGEGSEGASEFWRVHVRFQISDLDLDDGPELRVDAAAGATSATSS
ncbi:MAG: sensor histidine kinase [Oceanicaulis sp.]|nr:sensor histidine kinase [Oceanicaulis sp.]